MTGFDKPPAPPQGGDPISIWSRLLTKWLEKVQIRSIQGGKQIPDGNGGFHLILPTPKYPPPQPPAQPSPFLYPFKIYPNTTLDILVGQTLPMIPVGNPGGIASAKITDTNTPTNLNANPPTISIKDTWRFWQIRWGIVEFRPSYSLDTELVTFENFTLSLLLNDIGFGDMPDFSDETDPPTAEFVLGGVPDGNNAISALLYVKIAPDTSPSTFATATLNGAMVTVGGSAVIPPGFINGSPFVIPIGVIVGIITNLEAYNYRYDHAVGRYPVGGGNWPSNQGNTVMNNRGQAKYNEQGGQSFSQPTDLADQLFYPGDVMWYYQIDVDGVTVNHNGLFQFKGATPAFIQTDINGKPDPSSDSNWEAIFDVAQAPPAGEPI